MRYFQFKYMLLLLFKKKCVHIKIAFRAAVLEQENAILRSQMLTLRDEVTTLRQMICTTRPQQLTQAMGGVGGLVK